MNQVDPIIAEVVRSRRVYSAPRRFDLATLFVVMIVYACLLGLFVGVGVPDEVMFSILGFLTAVAISQPALFGGNMPRLSSVIVGGVALPLIFTMFSIFKLHHRMSSMDILLGGASCVPLGASFGYLAGAMVGGVFLVADLVRQGRGFIE